MSAHPTPQQLDEFAWDALEAAGAAAVESHVAGCAACALRVERVRAEARRLAGALEVPAPAGLAGRILDATSPAGQAGPAMARSSRLAPWLGVAAAALFAATAAWAWRGLERANQRIERLEKDLAAQRDKPPAVAPQGDALEAIIGQMRLEMEGEAGVVLSSTINLTPSERDDARALLADAAGATAQVAPGLALGRVDWDTLLGTDTLAALDTDLRAKFEPGTAQEIAAALDQRSRADALAVARALVGDLQAVAGLDKAQAASLETLVVDKTAWRRDFHFLPDVVQREMAARLIGAGGQLRPEAEALLNGPQRARVLSYLASAESERNRYWESLRDKAKKH